MSPWGREWASQGSARADCLAFPQRSSSSFLPGALDQPQQRAVHAVPLRSVGSCGGTESQCSRPGHCATPTRRRCPPLAEGCRAGSRGVGGAGGARGRG